MDDKDFMGYFTQLGNQNTEKLKQASTNIVSTLLALDSKMGRKSSMDLEESKVKEKAKAKAAPKAKEAPAPDIENSEDS